MGFTMFTKQIGAWNVNVYMPDAPDPRRRPVVLLHGFMQTADSWKTIAETLVQCGAAIVVPTMIPQSPDHATLGDYAMGVHDVLAWLRMQVFGVYRPHLVGYSMGGRIAVTLVGMLERKGVPALPMSWSNDENRLTDTNGTVDAKCHTDASRPSDIIASLTLESAGLGPKNRADRTAYATRNKAFAARIQDAETMEDVVDFWQSLPIFATQRHLSKNTQMAIRHARLSLAPYKANLAWAVDAAGAQHMNFQSKNEHILAQSGLPMCYIAGESDTKYQAVAKSIDKTCAPNIRVVHIAGGHDVHLENPHSYCAHLSAFLREHDVCTR